MLALIFGKVTIFVDVPISDPCSASSAVKTCLGFGASCFKRLSADGFLCQCAFPLVPSRKAGDDSCVTFESTGLTAATYDLTITGVTWSEKLKDTLSIEYLQLQSQLTTLLNTVLKEPSCPCSSDGPLDKSVGTLVSVANVDSTVTVTVQVLLADLTLVSTLKNAVVPGIDISVTAVKQVSVDKIVIQPDICGTPAAKADCGERTCTAAANLLGYTCDCAAPQVFTGGKCAIDVTLVPVGAEITLGNAWIEAYATETTEDYIKISTSIVALLQLAFKDVKVSLVNLFKATSLGSPTVGVKFLVLADASSTVDVLIASVKAVFGTADTYEFPGLVPLTLKVNSLEIKKNLLTCADVATCIAGGDLFALCKDDATLGPKCSCSSGFELKNDICVDIDECAANKCGPDGVCTNEVGTFSCACKDGFISSPVGCISTKPLPGCDATATAKCVALGAECVPNLSPLGYICQCKFPLVASRKVGEDLCVSIADAKLESKDYVLLLTGVTWSDKLADIKSVESSVLIADIKKLLNTVLKDDTCPCTSEGVLDKSIADVTKFEKQGEGVQATVTFLTTSTTKVDTVINIAVPGLSIKIAGLSETGTTTIVISPKICETAPAKAECGTESKCVPFADKKGYACTCDAPKVLKNGACVLDPVLVPVGGVMILSNEWKAAYADVSSTDYIKLSTTILDLLSVVFKSYSSSLVSIYEEKSSAASTVAFKFVVNTLPSVKEEDLLKSIKTLFGSGDTFVFHGLIDLKIVVSSLEVSGSVVKCADVNLCVSGGDLFALCVDDSAKGPTCTCSSGFEAVGGVCKDINECSAPNACNAPNANCVNLPGSFKCECPSGFLNSLTGCVDPVIVTPKDPCADQAASAKCLGYGAGCVKGISDLGYSCRCAFPLVASPTDDLCVSITTTSLTSVTYKLELKGVDWVEDLTNEKSAQAVILAAKVQLLINTVLKDQLPVSATSSILEKSVAAVLSFEKKGTVVVVEVAAFLKDQSLLQKILNVAVPGVDITVTSVTKVSEQVIVVKPDICTTDVAKLACGAEATCEAAVNELGFACSCPLKSVFKDGKCMLDEKLVSLVPLAAEITLGNIWAAAYSTVDSTEYITFKTAMSVVLKTVFGDVASFTGIVEEKTSSTSVVKVQFTVLVTEGTTADTLISQLKALFANKDPYTVPGLIDITLKVSSLVVNQPTCATLTTCAAGGDTLALCEDSAAGPVCKCSKGFLVNNGVCLDIDECKDPLACGIEGTVCTNKPGSFDCKCPAFFIDSLNGCIDPIAVAAKDPCAELSASSKCLAFGASCVKDLSDDFFACRCSFPLVPSTVPGDNTCVDVTKTDLVAVDAKVDLAGVVWNDKLADITSGEALVLKEQVEALLNGLLKSETPGSASGLEKSAATVTGFVKTATGVAAQVEFTVKDKAVIDTIKGAKVPGVDISVTAISEVTDKVATISALVCSTSLAKDKCVTDQECILTVNDVGFECACPIKTMLKDGACVPDPTVADLVLLGAELTLKNSWKAEYTDKKSEEYIKITTSIRSTLTTVFGDLAAFVDLVEASAAVKIKFTVLVAKNVTAEDLVAKFKAAFVGTDQVKVPGLVDLTLVISSLKVDKTILTCDSFTTCVTSGDSLALCVAGDAGPSCRCSIGFEEVNGVCVDINECAKPNPCGSAGGSCTNKPGGFDCACSDKYIPSLEGCTDKAISDVDPCIEGAAKCLAAGATCSKDISKQGYSCVCEFPLVFSPTAGTDLCVPVSSTSLTSVTVNVELKGVTWSDDLADLTKAAALVLKDTVEKLINTILKDQTVESSGLVQKSIATVLSFEKSSTGVKAEVRLTVTDKTVVDKLKNVVVPGIAVSVTAIAEVTENVLTVKAEICASSVVKDTCVADQDCSAVASETGFECSCPLKKILKDGSCVEDASKIGLVLLGAELTLKNTWIAAYGDTTSSDYITITTSIKAVLTSVFQEKASFTALVKEGSSVKVQFSVLVEATVTAAQLVEKFKAAFVGKDEAVVPGLVELTLVTSSLKVDNTILTCDVLTTCSISGDPLALCEKGDGKAPYCRCSTGFEDVKGVCVDINECEAPSPCGVQGTECTNKPGGFDCACGKAYLPSLVGCVDVLAVSKSDPCKDKGGDIKCLKAGAQCVKDLSDDGYSCVCSFPLAFSLKVGDDMCVDITTTELKALDVEVVLKGVTWSEKLADLTTAEALVLKDKVEKLVNNVLKDQTTASEGVLSKTVALVKSFESKSSSVVARVDVTVKDESVIEKLKDVVVSGIDISVSSATVVKEKTLVVNAEICTETVATTDCGTQDCTAVASDTGYECSCPLKTKLENKACVPDAEVTGLVLLGAEVTLKNAWTADFAVTTSDAYVKITTSITSVLKSVFGEKASFTALVQADSSVKVQFSVLVEATVTAATLVEKFKAAFKGSDEVVVPGLVELKLVVSSLKVDAALLTCDTFTTCTVSGDSFAVCQGGDKGPFCRCAAGFEEVKGVCVDVNECEKSNACGAGGSNCVNKPGGFDCTCAAQYLPSLVGCVDVAAVTKADPCADPSISAKCLLLGAKCEKDLSDDGYSCRCDFPLVSSPDAGVDKCVGIQTTELVSADVKLELKGVTWAEELSDVKSAAAVILADKVEKLINTILAEETTASVTLDKTVADVLSFEKKDSVVVANVRVTVTDKAVIDTIKEVTVPGIDISVVAVASVELNALTVSGEICASTVAKSTCVTDQTCAAVASKSGFDCSCSLKTILKDGSCVEDMSVSSFVLLAAEVTLKNSWVASYDKVSSSEYITFTTSAKKAISSIFGEKGSFTSLVKVDSFVKIQFSVLVDPSVTADKLVEKVKASFSGKEEVVIPGLVELTLVLKTLKVGEVLPSCDVLTTCAIAGDSFAVCQLGASGPACSCSTGFVELNGVCVDINECEKPNPCGVKGAECKNSVGGFSCTCPQNYLSSLVGCVDVIAVNAKDPCSDPTITAKCLALGAKCEKDLSEQGYACRCDFPLVPSPDSSVDKCVAVTKTKLATADVKLDLKVVAAAVTDDIADLTKAPALILADKVEELIYTVFKDMAPVSTGDLDKTVANVASFEKTTSGVTAKVRVTLDPETLVAATLTEKLKDVTVPGIDVTVAAVASVDVKELIVDAAICASTAATKDCGEATCSAVASDTGFKCNCGLKTLLQFGKCVEDTPALESVAYGAELQLTNAWSATLADQTTKEYVLFKTSVLAALDGVFGSKATFTEIKESSATVLVKFSVLLASAEKVDTYKSKITAAFAGQTSLTIPGLVDLTLTVSSLKIEKTLLTCTMLTSCVAKEDNLAICDESDKGPTCRCSTGFKEANGVCVDIDECATSGACGSPDAKCTNKPGGFDCSCPSTLLPSLVGCVDPKKIEALTYDTPTIVKCLNLGSSCRRELSATLLGCRCEFPLVPSQEPGVDKCVPITTTEKKAVVAKLELSGVTWSEKLENFESAEAAILVDKVEKLVNNVLKKEGGCTCGSPLNKGIITVEKLQQTTSGTVAAVAQINVKDDTVINKVKAVEVPGIDIQVTAVTKVEVKEVKVEPKICASSTTECGAGQTCAAVVSDTGFLCSCPLKTTFSTDGKCVEDVALSSFKSLEAELSLANAWKADYTDTTTAEYVKITTAVRKLLTELFRGKAQFTSIVEDKSSGSSVVKLQFEAVAEATKTADQFVSDTKAQFGTTEPQVVPGLVDLSLKISTLTAKLAPLNCDKSSCKDGGDSFALCAPSDTGFSCECSPGFEDKKGICTDINECARPDPCGKVAATCVNKPGSFECICPTGFLPSLQGCINVAEVSLAKPCSDPATVSKCVPFGGACAKDLSPDFFTCQCEFPLVPSTVPGEDKCVPIVSTPLKSAKYKLEISGVTWSDKLADPGSAEALILSDKIAAIVDTVLKDQLITSSKDALDTSIAQVKSFAQTATGLAAEAVITLADQMAIERVKNVVVPGVDVSISKITKDTTLELIVSAAACDSDAAKAECAVGSRTCVPTANAKGYDCVCDVPKLLVGDACKLLPEVRTTGGQFVLTNAWTADYLDVKKESFITFKTAATVLVKKVLGQSVTVAELFEDKSSGSSTVGIKLVELLTDGETDTKLVEDVKKVFNTEVYTAPGLVELFIRSSTVKFSETILTCSIAPTCTASGDAFALCGDAPAAGVSCKCSPGFQAKNNICVDIDECAKPDACGSGTCTNVLGSFKCDCGGSLLSSLQGCVDPVVIAASVSHTTPEAVSKCLKLGADPVKDLSKKLFGCRCEFPLVASSEPGQDTCVSVEDKKTKVAQVQLTLSNAKFSDKLNDIESPEALQLAEKVKRLADTVLKTESTQPSSELLDKSVAKVLGFVGVPGGVAADVELSSNGVLAPEKLTNAIVPGVDIVVASIAKVEDKVLVVSKDACALPAAVADCGTSRQCVIAANEKGYVCLCGAPKVEVAGECILDPTLSLVTGTVSLTNELSAAVADKTSSEYIKFSSSVTTTFTKILGSSFSLVSLEKSQSSNTVDVKFVQQADLKSTTAAGFVSKVQANFGVAPLTVPGLVPLGLKLDSLKVDDKPKCTTANTCSSGGDQGATCTDVPGVGISCKCTAGLEALNGVCTNIAACAKNSCGQYVCSTTPDKFVCTPPCTAPQVFVSGKCVDVKVDECKKPEATSACAALNGACGPAVKDSGYLCSCAAPFVPSQKAGEDKCVNAGVTGREFASFKLELGKEPFVPELQDKTSPAALVVEAKLKDLLNTALKDDTCSCSSSGTLDKSIAAVTKLEAGSTGVSATVELLVPETATAAVVESKVKNVFVAGNDLLVTGVKALPAPTVDVSVCSQPVCGADQTCVPTASATGFICQCSFPKVLKDGKCILDTVGVNNFGGSLQLTNTWIDAYSSTTSAEYQQLVASINTMFQFLFSTSSSTVSFSSVKNENSAVKISFYTGIESSVTADQFVAKVKASLGGNRFVARKVTTLKLDLDSLTVSKTLIKCGEKNLCTSLGDSFALCDDNAQTGAVCTCSEGFKLVNGFCVDIDECATQGICGAQGGVCSNGLGYFTCECSAAQLFSKDGCIDVSSTRDTCDAAAIKTCEALGAVCKKSLSKDGFQCQCALPKVASQSGSPACVDGVTTTDYRLELSGVTWTKDLASDFSKEFVALKAKLQKYLNTVLKFSSCACSSTGKLDQSVAVVNSFANAGVLSGSVSSTSVSAVVSVVAGAEAKIATLANTAVNGIDIKVTSAKKLALVTSADVCSSDAAKAACISGTACLPFANEVGFICRCTFPQIFSLATQVCQIDTAYTGAAGSFALASGWTDAYADKKSAGYIKLFSSVSLVIGSLFGESFTITSIAKDSSSTDIKVEFSASIDSKTTVEAALAAAKATFGSTEVFSFAVGVDLKIRASSLTLKKIIATCATSNTCIAGGDIYALCDDTPAEGIKCTCSEGFVVQNGVCVDIDECATGGCGSSSCTNIPGSFTCQCAAPAISSSDGCIAVSSTADTCTADAVSACAKFGAVCQKSLSATGYQCLCPPPSAAPQDGSNQCVQNAASSEYRLELSGVSWSSSLATDFSSEFVVLKKKLQRYLNTVLKTSGCACGSSKLLDQSVAFVSSFENEGLLLGGESSSAVSAVVSISSKAEAQLSKLTAAGLEVKGIDVRVTKATKLARVVSASICTTVGSSACGADKTCRPFANEKGFICECLFPTVPKDGKCSMDSSLSAVPGALVLTNAWDDAYSDKTTEKHVRLYSSISYMLQAIFKTSSFVISSVAKESLSGGAFGVKVVFSLNINSASTVDTALATAKTTFGTTEVFSFTVGLNLRLKVSTLILSARVVTCAEVNICATGGDKFALCGDRPTGPECTCSPGFKNQNAICVDIDECLNPVCGEGGTCTNGVGFFTCTCPTGKVSSPDGCISFDRNVDSCAAGGNTDCTSFGAGCVIGLFAKGYSCQCQLPLVPLPTDSKCIDQSQTNLTTADYNLQLKGVAWKDEYADQRSAECLGLKQQTQKAVNTVLKYEGCPCSSSGNLNRGVAQCKGFSRTPAAARRQARQLDGVTALVQISLQPGFDINKLVGAVIPGLPFTIGGIAKVNPSLPTGCTAAAQLDCGPDRDCLSATNDKGYVCACRDNKIFVDGKCVAVSINSCDPNPCVKGGDARGTCMQKETTFVCSCSIPFYEFDGTTCKKKSFFSLFKGVNFITAIFNFFLFLPTFIVNLVLRLANDFPIGRALDQQYNGRQELIENVARIFRG